MISNFLIFNINLLIFCCSDLFYRNISGCNFNNKGVIYIHTYISYIQMPRCGMIICSPYNYLSQVGIELNLIVTVLKEYKTL